MAWVGRDLKAHPVPAPCRGQCQPAAQAVQGPIQPGLPREAVGVPSPEALTARLDGVLGSLSQWWQPCPRQGVGTR